MAESGGPRCKLLNLIKKLLHPTLDIFLRFGLMGRILTLLQRVFPLLLTLVQLLHYQAMVSAIRRTTMPYATMMMATVVQMKI